MIELLAIEPNPLAPTFQFPTGLLAASSERQVVGIMYKHLSPQSIFRDTLARLIEKLQKIRGQNVYLGANIAGELEIPCL